jgi:DNA-binding transcriptional ArsR family regulator
MNGMIELEKLLKALANRRRLAILIFLKHGGEASVGAVAQEIKLSFRSTSKHLGVLRAVGILEREQRNLQMFYTISRGVRVPVDRVINFL